MSDTNTMTATEGVSDRSFGEPIMEMKNITMRFGGVVAIQDISFDIFSKSGSINSCCLIPWL